MRNIISLLIFILASYTSFAQLQNGDFENWSMVSGFDNPDHWYTSNYGNYPSVFKSTDSYTGNYAMQVKSENLSIDGWAPGVAWQHGIAYTNMDTLKVYVRIDSIAPHGKAIIKIMGIDTINPPPPIITWEDSVVYNNYKLISIPLFNNSTVHKIYIDIVAGELYLPGPNQIAVVGYASFHIDNIHFTSTVGIEEFNLNDKVSISPNPVAGNFQLNSNSEISVEKMEIYDIKGKLIKHFNGQQSNYSLADVSSGIYFIKISTPKGSAVKKLIKK